MYYKIENKESEVYKKLYEMRTEELQIEKDNKKAVHEKVGLEYKSYLGTPGQQTFGRVSHYSGFKFSDPKKVDLKVWKRHKEHTDVFVPNRRTKVGKEMNKFLLNGLKSSGFERPLEILGLKLYGSFKFPYVELKDTLILLFLDDKLEPKDPNLI